MIAASSSPEILAEAIEANGRGFLLELGRAGGGAYRNDHLEWTIGGSPIDYHNAVVSARLTPETADAAIVESADMFRERNVPGSWHVGPSMTPKDLPRRLAAKGFQHGGDDVGMAADLLRLSPMPEIAGFRVAEVLTETALTDWTDTASRGFGEGPAEIGWVGEMYRKLGYGPGRDWRHYVGWLDGVPVATSTMYLGAGVAGLYFVFTLPAARGRGVGAAMTLAPLADAVSLGYQVGVLGASPMGEPVYRRIGFEAYCNIGIFEWPYD
jgi:GNAT superfamily N-acetyltransferase